MLEKRILMLEKRFLRMASVCINLILVDYVLVLECVYF